VIYFFTMQELEGFLTSRIEEAQRGEFSTQDFDGIIAKAKKKWRNARK
jgi:hypothetical protein